MRAMQFVNPNKERKDYIYRPGGPELKDVLKEELEKATRPDAVAGYQALMKISAIAKTRRKKNLEHVIP